MPTMVQAGLYSATMHYLKAVQAAGTSETAKVLAKIVITQGVPGRGRHGLGVRSPPPLPSDGLADSLSG